MQEPHCEILCGSSKVPNYSGKYHTGYKDIAKSRKQCMQVLVLPIRAQRQSNKTHSFHRILQLFHPYSPHPRTTWGS